MNNRTGFAIAQISERRLSPILATVERLDHRCGDDLIERFCGLIFVFVCSLTLPLMRPGYDDNYRSCSVRLVEWQQTLSLGCDLFLFQVFIYFPPNAASLRYKLVHYCDLDITSQRSKVILLLCVLSYIV